MHKPAFNVFPDISGAFQHLFTASLCCAVDDFRLLIQIAQSIQFVIQNKETFCNVPTADAKSALRVLAHSAFAASEQGGMKDVGAAECTVAYIARSHSHCFMSGEWKLRGSVFRSKAST